MSNTEVSVKCSVLCLILSFCLGLASPAIVINFL